MAGRSLLWVCAFVALSLLGGCTQPPSETPISPERAESPDQSVNDASDRAPEQGVERPDPQTNERLKSAVAASALGVSAARDYYGDAVTIGPALWIRLSEDDPALVGKAVPATCIIPGNPPGEYELGVFQQDAVPALLDSSALKAITQRLSQGDVRAATDFERGVYYAQIPYEISNQPLSVVEYQGEVLLIDFDDDNKVLWLEMVSDWRMD